MKIVMVEDWKDFHKWWSVHLNIIAGAITSFFVIWPDSAYTIWLNFPQAIKDMIPDRYVILIGVVIYVMSMIARIVTTQKAKDRKAAKRETANETTK